MKGWRFQSWRHSLAAKGIRTSYMPLLARGSVVRVPEIKNGDLDTGMKDSIRRIRAAGYDTAYCCSGIVKDHKGIKSSPSTVPYVSIEVKDDQLTPGFKEGMERISRKSGWDVEYSVSSRDGKRHVTFYNNRVPESGKFIGRVAEGNFRYDDNPSNDVERARSIERLTKAIEEEPVEVLE